MYKSNFDPVDIAGMAPNFNQEKLKSDIDLDKVDDDFLFDHPGADKLSDIDDDIEAIQKLFRDMDAGSVDGSKLDSMMNVGNDSDSSFNSDLSDGLGSSKPRSRPVLTGKINTFSSQPNTYDNQSNTFSPQTNTFGSQPNTFSSQANTHTFRYKDPEYQAIEGAVERQKRVNNVMLTFVEENQTDFIELEKKAEEDNKYIWLNDIDMLKDSIKGYGVKIDNIPEVTIDSSPEDIYNTYQLLIYKYDCATNWGMVEEAIEMGAEGIEWFFNGKRDIFGSKPDASGFKRNTTLKLRKLRYKSAKAIKRSASAASSEGGLFSALAWELIPALAFQIRANGKKKSDVDEIQEGLTNISMYN
jgi:hypothetical protein